MTARNDLKPKDSGKKPATTAVAPAPAERQSGLTFNQFVQEFDGEGREKEITALLPHNVPFNRFRSCAISAVKQNPEILTATPRSVFNALTKAAQDGLLPDGREGFINVYNTKTKVRGVEVWLPTAQWMPMTFGIRKRARELDSLIIDAQVVYMNDHFEWHQGDEPKIVHVPIAPGKGDRGEKVGAYAIFKRETGAILHREVMDFGQIEKVREQSKSPDGLLWKKFAEEAFRKSVVRRGAKTVPVSDNLRQIIQRDDDDFDFSKDGAHSQPAVEGVLIPPRPKQSDFQPKDPVPPKGQSNETKPATNGDPRPEPPLEGEILDTQSEPEPKNEQTGGVETGFDEPEETQQEPPATSPAYDAAEKWINAAEESRYCPK